MKTKLHRILYLGLLTSVVGDSNTTVAENDDILDAELAAGEIRLDSSTHNQISVTVDGPWNETFASLFVHYSVPVTFFVPISALRSAAESEKLFKAAQRTGIKLGLRIGPTETLKNISNALAIARSNNHPIGVVRIVGTSERVGRALAKRIGATQVGWSHDINNVAITSLPKVSSAIIRIDGSRTNRLRIQRLLSVIEGENCRRLDNRKALLHPVSLHYFVRDGRSPRQIPDDVQVRSEAYKASLSDRCVKGNPKKPKGDFPVPPKRETNPKCRDPLSRSCM